MDQMNIVSKFTTGIISKIITKMLRKKLGNNFDIRLSMMKVSIKDEKAHICLDIDAEIGKEELIKLIKNADLN